MDGRPTKRQRRSVHPERTLSRSSKSDSPPIDIPSSSPSSSSAAAVLALTSRPKANPKSKNPKTRAVPRAPSSSVSPQKAKPQLKQSSLSPNTKSQSKSKSLHTFFQPATEAQRWSAQKFEPRRPLAASSDLTFDADIIEDDYDSYDEIFSQHLHVGGGSDSGGGNGGRGMTKTNKGTETVVQIESPVVHGAGGGKSRRPMLKKPTTTTKTLHSSTRARSHTSKRFLMPTEDVTGNEGGGSRQRSVSVPASGTLSTAEQEDVDTRPWAQRYAPANLDEVAVHKRKVSDVQRWLKDVFAGRRREVSCL